MSPFAVFVFLLGLSVASTLHFTTVYEWGEQEMSIARPPQANKTRRKQEKITPMQLAVYKERVFLSLIKFWSGPPVTLVSLPTSTASSAPPKLTPFPNWKMHNAENCDRINKAIGLEVDLNGRLWVVDIGTDSCKAKLWIFNLESDDALELVHHFPKTVVPFIEDDSSRWLRGIVLDETPDDTVAFITDMDSAHIIAFSLRRKLSWSVKTPGKSFNAVALSPKEESRQLYLGSRDGSKLYSLPVAELRGNAANASPTLIGEWSGTPYRMLLDDANVLCAAFETKNYISTWNTTEPFREQRIYEVGDLTRAIPKFMFGLDEAGTLWLMELNKNESSPRNKLLKAAVLS